LCLPFPVANKSQLITAKAKINRHFVCKLAVKGLTESLCMGAWASFPYVTVCVDHLGGIDTAISDHAIPVGKWRTKLRRRWYTPAKRN
jgi:hypothetical protein